VGRNRGSGTADAARAAVVRVCRRLYERGLIAGGDGNVSVLLDDDSILVTPSGVSKVDVAPEDLVVVNRRGGVLAGRLAPSSELRMHLRMYDRRPEVRAVVHAHPPVATGFAVAGESFLTPVLPEVILQMGGGGEGARPEAGVGVPLVRYATPGTEALADNFDAFLSAGYHAFLLANHGATTIGTTLEVAHQRMESLEHTARILLAARVLGQVNALTADDVRALLASREDRG
jgi:L-fuculose-phosphate aldolase